jgi:hypothetical protein
MGKTSVAHGKTHSIKGGLKVEHGEIQTHSVSFRSIGPGRAEPSGSGFSEAHETPPDSSHLFTGAGTV